MARIFAYDGRLGRPRLGWWDRRVRPAWLRQALVRVILAGWRFMPRWARLWAYLHDGLDWR